MNKEFNKVLSEFIPDLLECFPEYKDQVHKGIHAIIKNYSHEDQENKEDEDFELCVGEEEQNLMNKVYEHSKSVIPERFFDILYKNEDIFKNKEFNTEFLVGIHFSELWNHTDITDKTQEIIWKYLQLFLFSIVSDMKDGNSFGDTAKLFEAINENDFKTKLEETMEEMQSFFDDLEKNDKEDKSTDNNENTNEEQTNNGSTAHNKDIPNPEKIHEHIQSMMGGKIGCLAKEIAEETMKDMDIDLNLKEGEEMSPDSLFKQLFKDPTKLMGITKNIGSKLETRMKTGDIKEEELMQEASEMMTKMKEMPGMDQFNDIIKAFGGNMGKTNTKASHNAMSQKFNQMSMRQRMQDILKQRQQNKQQTTESFPLGESNVLQIQNEPIHTIEGEGKNKVFKLNDPEMTQTKTKRPNKKKKRANKKKAAKTVQKN